MMKDTYRHKGLRARLVAQLRDKGIEQERVLEAIEAIPRHFFLDKAFEEQAYEDKAFGIGSGQTISQPYTVAYMTSLLNIQKRDKVLEVGTGSGYQAAILAYLGARVFSVERQEELYHRAKALLRKLRVGNIRIYYRDGYAGLPEFAPFDKILVTAGAPEVPSALLEQLAIGGMLVIPVDKPDEKGQQMMRITRLTATTYDREIYGDFRFVPFLRGKVRKE